MSLKLYDKLQVNYGMHWDLPFFEGAGGMAHDISRGHLNGLLGAGAQAPTWTQLATGYMVLLYDGSDDYIELPSAALQGLANNDFTLEFWTNKGAGLDKMIVCQTATVNVDQIFFQAYSSAGPNGVAVLARVGGVAYNIYSLPPDDIGFTSGSWHYIVITRQNINTWTVFVDGKSSAMWGNTDLNYPNWGDLCYLGAFRIFVGPPPGWMTLNVYDGYLSRPRLILNHAYSFEEVQLNYQRGRRFYQ